jgi:hypothetical protein
LIHKGFNEPDDIHHRCFMSSRPEKESSTAASFGFIALGLITSKILYAFAVAPLISLVVGVTVAATAAVLASRLGSQEPVE